MNEEMQTTKFEKIVIWTAMPVYAAQGTPSWEGASAVDYIVERLHEIPDIDILECVVAGEYKLVKIEE